MSLPPDMFRSQIAEAKKRLVQLMREQQKINEEITDLRELIRANTNFLPDLERTAELSFLEFLKPPVNITEAVRLAIFVASVLGLKVTPLEIRQRAESLGFDFSEYSNPMASIHTILKRMREATPPGVSYDERNDCYWFGETVLFAAYDLVNPQLFADAYVDVIKELVAGTDGEMARAVIHNVAVTSLSKKAEIIAGKGKRN